MYESFTQRFERNEPQITRSYSSLYRSATTPGALGSELGEDTNFHINEEIEGEGGEGRL